MKRSYSSLSLKEAAGLISARQFALWKLDTPPRPPSAFLIEDLRRLKVFDLEATEAAKSLLIDALLAEVVPNYPGLKVWKSMPLETDSLLGTVDYLLAPNYVYLSTPLLCIVEAKRDDFVAGRAQCIAEMSACVWNNHQEGFSPDLFGVVSNGQVWQFYRLTQANEIFESGLFTLDDLPNLLSALDQVIAACAANLPSEETAPGVPGKPR